MKNIVLLLGPTLMIFIGLQLFESVLITFLLFYGWLLVMPIISRSISIRELGWTFNGSSISAGLLSGSIFFFFIFVGLQWLHHYFIDIGKLQLLLEDWGFSGNGVIGLILVLLIINPILEEVYWRGFMLEKLKAKRNAVFAIWITSFFYTLYHLLSVIPMFQWPLSAVAVLPVFFAGLIWGYIKAKTSSIYGIIISHMLSDLGIMCVYWFIVRY